ncbi:Transmembrane and coiled-coil domains protein 1, partial [Anabarilius grahami]
AVSYGADGSLLGSEDAGLDPQRTRQAIAQLQQKILKLTEQLRIEQAARDENVAEYLKLASNASDKQQSTRIKQRVDTQTASFHYIQIHHFKAGTHQADAFVLRSSSGHLIMLIGWPPAGMERHFILRKRRTDVLLGRRLLSVALMCQANFGPRRCRREPTPQSAFVATSSSASAWGRSHIAPKQKSGKCGRAAFSFFPKRLRSRGVCRFYATMNCALHEVFEKKNQKSAASIAQLQRKLEHYHRRLREAEHSGVQRQPKDVLRDMQQGLRDVGARVITGLSEGVVDSVKGGLSSFSHATHSAAGAVASKPREIASLIRNRLGSADNINVLKDGAEDGEDTVTGRSLGSAAGRLQSSPKFDSDEDCSSTTSGSAEAHSVTGAPGGPPSSRGNTLERGHGGGWDMLLQEVQELRDTQAQLEESLESLKSGYLKECERLEEQVSDLTELHQNEILNLKQELVSMEEKIAYQSNERARDLQEALEACQTRVSKMELQQQQQQVVQLEGLENATARTLLGKLINVLLALMAVLLVFVSTVANCVVPLMKTRSRSVSSLLLFLLFAVLWRNWDTFSGHTYRFLHVPR